MSESLRDRPLYNGGTWGGHFDALGVPWDETSARLAAGDIRYAEKLMRGKAAKREALPVYKGSPPTNLEEVAALIAEIGTTWSKLSEETVAAIMRLREEAIAAGGPVVEASATQPAPPPADAPRMPPQCTADRRTPSKITPHHGCPLGAKDHPRHASSVPELYPDLDSAGDPTPPTVVERRRTISTPRPVPEPTGEGETIALWGDVTMRVWPEEGGAYPIEFLKGNVRVCIEGPKSPPWISSRLQERLTAGLTSALGDEARHPDFMRRKITEAFAALAKRLETDDGTKRALTPAAVRKVIERTDRVIVYPSQATTYEITIGGRSLSITAQQMARTDPGFINAAWLNLFPTDPLNATRREWLQVQSAWTDAAVVEVCEVEEMTEAEIVIERLRADLETIALVESPDQVKGDNTAWKDPGTGEVWVPARRITRFLDETVKKPGWSSRLSKEVQAAGGMKGPTRTKKMGAPARDTRCWIFTPDFATFKGGRAVGAKVTDCLPAGECENR